MLRHGLATSLVVLSGVVLLSVPQADARPRANAATAAAGIVVDVSRLRATGLGPTADLLQAAVARELAGAVGGARVTVRLTGFSFASYAGSDGGGGGSGGDGGGAGGIVDYLEGDFQVIGAGGAVLAERHQVSSSPASSGGAYYLPGAEERRVEAAGRTFAAWVKRSLQ